MRITIVNGFFLPVPPVAGGATEKSWYALAREFARRGHEVTSVSREWAAFPEREVRDGVVHVRIRGFDHRRRLWQNLLLDMIWSSRVQQVLPTADILVCNAVALPIWVRRRRPDAGALVLMAGRMPKGQYRRYYDVARVLAPSSFVKDRILVENPSLDDRMRVSGYPIDWASLAAKRSDAGTRAITIGYVGRIHPEKGLVVLAEALQRLAMRKGLPPWRVLLCGPTDVAEGGGGASFHNELRGRLQSLPGATTEWLDPEFNASSLAAVYRRIDVFCYPSVAEQGETFGVAVAEAMAAGALPVVSDLACFRDFVRHDQTGRVFDHNDSNPAKRLEEQLAATLQDPAMRQRIAAAARTETQRFDFPRFADALLEDFAGLARR